MKKTYIIIACYNEAPVIKSVVEELLSRGHKVILVDDASTDGSAEQLRDLDIHLLRHSMNLGQGAALQTGMSYALKLGADFVLHFDADGQHNPDEIPLFLAPLLAGETDVVLGSRFLDKAHSREVPFGRRILLKMAILVNGFFSGIWLTDAHNGFRGLNRKALQKIHLTENRMAHATEILIEIKKNKLRYKEVPSKIIYSKYAQQKGQSSLNAISILMDLIFNRMVRR